MKTEFSKKLEKPLIAVGSILGLGIAGLFAFAFFIGTVSVLYGTFINAIYIKHSLREFMLGMFALACILLLDSWTIWPFFILILDKFGFTIEIKKNGKLWPEQNEL